MAQLEADHEAIGEVGPRYPVEAVIQPSAPPSRHQEMLASIHRTGLLTDRVFIPGIPAEELAAGNQSVEERHGDSARHLLIAGPDVIILEGCNSAVRIRNAMAAEYLGYAIWLRQPQSPDVYEMEGIFDDSTGVASVHAGIILAHSAINRLASGWERPLSTVSHPSGGVEYGIDDVIVKDLRHTNAYAAARQQHSTKLFEDYVLRGTDRPRMSEEAMIRGARNALRNVVRIFDRESPDIEAQLARYAEVNEEQAAMVESRTTLNEEAHPLVNRQGAATLMATAPGEDDRDRWQTKAMCRGPQSVFFFPPPSFERKDEKTARQRRAKQICAGCSVRSECLEYALGIREPHGIYGGLTEKERKALLSPR